MYKHFDTVPNFKLSFRFRLQENVKHVCDKEIFEPAWKQRIHYGAPCLDKSLRYNVKVSSGNILFCIYSSVFLQCVICVQIWQAHIFLPLYMWNAQSRVEIPSLLSLRSEVTEAKRRPSSSSSEGLLHSPTSLWHCRIWKITFIYHCSDNFHLDRTGIFSGVSPRGSLFKLCDKKKRNKDESLWCSVSIFL